MRNIAYDTNSGTLLTELSDGSLYKVFDLPTAIYDALVAAPSFQEYFNAHIWGSKFEHDRHWPDLSSLLVYLEDNMLFPDGPLTIHTTQADGTTPLHVACTWGDIGAVDLLIAAGAPIHARGDMDTTPLYDAVSFNHLRCVERLLQAGASVDDTNQMDWTAREMATYRQQTAVLELFAQYAQSYQNKSI